MKTIKFLAVYLVYSLIAYCFRGYADVYTIVGDMLIVTMWHFCIWAVKTSMAEESDKRETKEWNNGYF